MGMKLQDFVAVERMSAIKFHEWWTLQHRTNPDDFPLSMEPQDWDEQYMIWDRDDG